MADFSLLLNMGFMVIAAAFSLYIAKIFKQPALMGYLLAGVIIGPIGLGVLSDPEEIALLSELGIIFLLFTIGAETDFLKFLRNGSTILLGGIAQVSLTILLAFFIFPQLGITGTLYVGLALALSSTMVVIRVLQNRKVLQSLHGQLMLGFLLVQDVAVIVALPILAANQAITFDLIQFLFLKGVFLIALVGVLSHAIFPRLYRIAANSSELLYLTALATCFGFIGIAYLLNISLAIGAFLAGLAIAQLPYNLEAISSIRGLRDFFVMIFFVSLGSQLTGIPSTITLGLVGILVLFVFVLKPLILYILTQLAGYGSQTAGKVAFGMGQMSEFSLILLTQGFISGAVPRDLFEMLLFLAAFSMAVTPYYMDFGPRFQGWLKKVLPVKVFSHFPIFARRVEAMQHVDEKRLDDHIIILGGGRVGKYLAFGLHRKNHVLVIDHDPQEVAYLRAKKVPAIYGNAHSTEILENVHADKAKLLIIVIPDIPEAMYITDYVKHYFPRLKIFVKANYYEEAMKLYKLGADYVVLTEIIGGKSFMENVNFFLRKGRPMTIPNMVKLKEQIYRERELHHVRNDL
ncbi:MAG: cation:proton antiporter [Candidatus Diapherotrites archaeon]|nr:cation:proton antiporter [Candidatus Diapherotrites archaeon]